MIKAGECTSNRTGSPEGKLSTNALRNGSGASETVLSFVGKRESISIVSKAGLQIVYIGVSFLPAGTDSDATQGRDSEFPEASRQPSNFRTNKPVVKIPLTISGCRRQSGEALFEADVS